MTPDYLTLNITRRAATAILPLIHWLDTHTPSEIPGVADSADYDTLVTEIERQTRAHYDRLKQPA